MNADAVVVGAGLAGLACAARLVRSGARVVVLEKSRGVGGRCATRRVENQPVDFGPGFLHGSDPRFAKAVEEVSGATLLPGWPSRLHGAGHPCQPDAFQPGESRWAFAEGLNAFPKHLACDLDIRRQTRVMGIADRGKELELLTEAGETFRAPAVALALPLEQARELLTTCPDPPPSLHSGLALLNMVGSHPCLCAFAGYPLKGPAPEWDMCYPEATSVLQVVAHDSAKRVQPKARVLVLQALTSWSRQHLEETPEAWIPAILEETRQVVGEWAGSPLWVLGHRWRFARVDQGCEFSGPMVLAFPGGPRLGLAGEVFFPGGGIEAAFLSGERLAERLAGG